MDIAKLEPAPPAEPSTPQVKLLTWNIQAAVFTRQYPDYLLNAHRQLVHTPAKTQTLQAIAAGIAPYDIVALQEVDLGGRRAGYRSQVAEIAKISGHAYTAVQENRHVPGISRHGNAILSRWPLSGVRDLKLPGRIAGRGCLIAEIQTPAALTIASLHLSLGARDQHLQLAAIAGALQGRRSWAAMGDFNGGPLSPPLQAFCGLTGGQVAGEPAPTYPAWRPRRALDHVVVRGLAVSDYRPEPLLLSDHLAVSAQVARAVLPPLKADP